MIADTMERLGLYEGLLPQAALLQRLWRDDAWDEETDFEVRRKRYETKPDAARKFEVHAHTIDLMIGRAGQEIIHLCPAAELEPGEPLPGGADGMKLRGGPRGSALLLRPGRFIAIYPGEAHMVGGIPAGGAGAQIEKLVVKLPCRDACPCQSECARHGVCAACVAWHRNPSNSLPSCLREKGKLLVERAMKAREQEK